MLSSAVILGLLVAAVPGTAAVMLFQGFDPGAGPGDPHPVSSLAESGFAAAVSPFTEEPLSVNNWDAFPTGPGGGYGWDAGKNLVFAGTGAFQSFVVDVAGAAATGFNVSASGVKFNRLVPQTGHTSAGLRFSSDDEHAAGFGVYLTGFGGSGDSLEFSLSDGTPYVFPIAAPAEAGVLFAGFVSDAYFDSVALRWENPSGLADTFAIDDVTWASSPIPEPRPSWTVATALAILALGGVLRRRRYA